MSDKDPAHLIYYGVWVRERGWLRGKDSKALAFVHKIQAQSAVKMYGPGARVEIIDDSLADIEAELLKREQVKIEASLICRGARWWANAKRALRK